MGEDLLEPLLRRILMPRVYLRGELGISRAAGGFSPPVFESPSQRVEYFKKIDQHDHAPTCTGQHLGGCVKGVWPGALPTRCLQRCGALESERSLRCRLPRRSWHSSTCQLSDLAEFSLTCMPPTLQPPSHKWPEHNLQSGALWSDRLRAVQDVGSVAKVPEKRVREERDRVSYSQVQRRMLLRGVAPDRASFPLRLW